MDAEKAVAVESRLELAHAEVDEKSAGAHVHGHVVVVGLETLDVGNGDR